MPTVDLERALAAAGLAAPVRWDEVTGSTNATALAMAEEGAPEWTLVGAGHQTAGRGRLGRPWHDRPGRSLIVSVVLRPSLHPSSAGLLTLLAGAAWAEAIADVAGVAVRTRWPNDLVLAGAKAGGILAEAALEPGGRSFRHVVLGSGVNLAAPEDVVPAVGIGDVDPTVLLGAFLSAFRSGYPMPASRFAEVVTDRWRAVSATLGRHVRATRQGGGAVEGVAIDVDGAGALVVEAGTGRATVAFGALEHLD
jgi:BirA family transcriptional regulator, biotin operon repressor / biotin---[acetyl-CoA-carboxylase] ligase